MHKVFVSYAREDSAAAKAISVDLTRRGYAVFYDTALTSGESFDSVAWQALGSAEIIIVLLSRNTARSTWVQKEVSAAIRSSRIVLPVFLDPEGENNSIWPLLADREVIRDFDLESIPAAVGSRIDQLLRAEPLRSPDSLQQAAPRRQRLLYLVSGVAGAAISLAIALYQIYFVSSPEVVAVAPISSPTTSGPIVDAHPRVGVCRLPENGIESYAKEAQAVIDSGWIGGGNSPASFCTAQVVQRRNQHPDHIVELLKSEERSKRDLLLAVRYRYSCVLVEKWDPVYKLGPNSACPK